MQYSPTEGNATLRAIVADRYTALGLPTRAENIVITTGSQQGLSLLAATLVDPGDAVLVERPSYLAALQALTLAGARLIEVPSNGDGVDLDALAELARRHSARLFYTVPTFHNPTGRTLDAHQRGRIAEIAQQVGFRVIADDPYHELRYSGESLAPMAAFCDSDHVVSTGSFSKILAPGLRLGFVRCDPTIKPGLVVAKQSADLHTSTLDQAAAAHYLATGRLSASLARARCEYGRRRDALLAGLESALPPGSRWTNPDGGMFVWAELPEGWDAAVLLPTAIAHQVAFVPGASFFASAPRANTMRLSFTTYDPETIAEGTRRLGLALAG
nr:PLP-dependent aminotransferase family protein [Microlunatus panaciterrae]